MGYNDLEMIDKYTILISTRQERGFPMSNEAKKQQDELLFETLQKNKKRRKRKILITVISIVLALAIAVTIAVVVLTKQVREQFALDDVDVLSHTAATGTISTLVSGSGTLQDVDPEAITVPEGVEILEVLVKRNDAVKEGDILATVDTASVISAMADLQEQLKELDKQLSDAEDDKVSAKITSGVSGRVKAIYGKKGTSVTDTMYEHGALAILSLDGYMAAEVTTDTLHEGDKVTVVLSGGDKVTGRVSDTVNGTARVLISDNGAKYEEEVTVLSQDGATLGTAKLSINNPLRITGYAGTVSAVKVKENQKVTDTTLLFTLTDRSYSANYETLLRERQDAEDILLELLEIRKNGAVVAPFDGSVYSTDHDEELAPTSVVTLSRDEEMYVTITVDESDILSLQEGQKVNVTVSSVSEDAFSGTVTQIDKSVNNDAGAYTAEVTFPKEKGMLTGMTADVDVQIQGVKNAVLLPVDAVHLTSDRAYVYTSYDEKTQTYGGKTDVVVGLTDGTYYEITEGLAAGTTVYYTKSKSLMDFFAGMMGMGGGNKGNTGNKGNMGNFGGNFGGGQMAQHAPSRRHAQLSR